MNYQDQRRAYRAQRRAYRRSQRPLSGLAGGFFFIGLVAAIYASSTLGGDWFLPIFFVGLAFSSLLGSISSYNRWGIYGGFHSFLWLIVLALFFLTGSWLWFLLAIGVSMILGALVRPIMAGLLGIGALSLANQPQQPYQPYQQPYQPEQAPYQQGYQPPPPAEAYQEGGQQYQYPQPQPQQPQYDQPETPYTQEMPPQQQ